MKGRKSKYEEAVKPYLDEINKKVQEGVIEEEIAKSLGISVATLNNYKLKYPELKEALSKDKGIAVLQKLINAGIESACGYYKDEITIVKDEVGRERKNVTRRWYPPNATLNRFYVMNFGKDKGFVDSPLDYELKKAKQELDEALIKDKNWDVDFGDND